jgi:transposase
MEEINRFVVLAQSGRFSVTDLCEQFGISRKTGYKHLERYAALGMAGLRPRSHRPHHCPQRTDERPKKSGQKSDRPCFLRSRAT